MAKTINKKATNATRKNGYDEKFLKSLEPIERAPKKTVDKSKLQPIKSTKKQTKVGAAANAAKDYLGIGNGYLKAVSQTNQAKREKRAEEKKLVPLKTYKPKKTAAKKDDKLVPLKTYKPKKKK